MSSKVDKPNDQHSGRTRVEPVFQWFKEHAGARWVSDFLGLADGIAVTSDIGKVVKLTVGKERTVPASPSRLAWMIRNAHRLAPQDGRRWREYGTRVIHNPKKDKALQQLDRGKTNDIPKELILEGATHADCLIECDHAFVWIEGKRNDWLAPSITWDVTRDQLARNLEAAWLLATENKKDFWLVVCHEHTLKHHEEELIRGYRAGTWRAGLPHLSDKERDLIRTKIGTLTWEKVFSRWPDARPSCP